MLSIERRESRIVDLVEGANTTDLQSLETDGRVGEVWGGEKLNFTLTLLGLLRWIASIAREEDEISA